jgi:hypothetical protein
MFDALHDDIPCYGINSAHTASFHFIRNRFLIRKEPPEGGPVVSSVVYQDQL